MLLHKLDKSLISFTNSVYMPLARFGLFVVFFWFGILKVVGQSPASDLVQNLFNNTIPFMDFATFFVLFGLFECLIGILFLIRGLERVVIPLLFLHMFMTFGPLVLLSSETWSGFLIPTLEGQYIIKNLVIIALVIGIASKLEPLSVKSE